MNNSIQGVIFYRGNVARHGIARPRTVLRYFERIATCRDLKNYAVHYYWRHQVYRESAIAFIEKWRAEEAAMQQFIDSNN